MPKYIKSIHFDARGIAAEPPKRKRTSGARTREGDGADSPTRAATKWRRSGSPQTLI
jgi:hypothetical protein